MRWGANWGGLEPIIGMAIGVVAGGLVQALCQLPTLYRVGYKWEKRQDQDPAWSQDPRLRTMMWMMVPGTIGLAATQVNLLVNTVLATTQGPGAVSWLNYAFRLMQFPIGIFGVSLASATLPRISYQWARNDIRGVRDTLNHSLRSVFAINLPASAGLAFLGYPIIEMIFQYGRFQKEDTRATAAALAMYSIGLTAYSAVKVLVPACYALGNTRLPVLSSVLAVIMTISLNLMMVKPFGFQGLALGTSLAAILNSLFLLCVIRKLIREKGEGFAIAPLLRSFLVYLGIALFMGVICYVSDQILTIWLEKALMQLQPGKFGIVLGRAMKLSALMVEGVVIVLITVKMLQLKEATEVIDLFAGKLKNKLRRNST
jgi:putative peptidoglycan lipid II flippase